MTDNENGDAEEHGTKQFWVPWECLKVLMPTLEGGKTTHLDIHGDLTLKVGGDKIAHEFVVCSRTLGRGSPVFQAMLFSGFAESKPADGAWIVQLPDDLPSPMLIVLHIIHGHFEHIPQALEQHELYQLLVVTEKYDMTKILRPWASKWFDPYKKTTSVNGNQSLLWISWELGHEEVFLRLAKDLMFKIRLGDENELLGNPAGDQSIWCRLVSSGLLETISKGRNDIIQQITTLLYTTTGRLYTAPLCKGKPILQCSVCGTPVIYGDHAGLHWCNLCNCRVASTASFRLLQSLCGNMIFGSVSKLITGIGLKKVALLETPTPRYLGSINKLTRDINKMVINPPEEHGACDPLWDLKAEVRKLVNNAAAPVTDQHRQYLQEQAKKTGI
ncbi:hypothetical protein CcaCcLH18_03479 [Colletotrichum camelliae]|nr:hypothetical protein CcaCcLH18_03479 [Colletotrichum camelliae]